MDTSLLIFLTRMPHVPTGFHQSYVEVLNKIREKYFLEDIHEGEANQHLGGRSIAKKTLSTKYYWQEVRKMLEILRCTHSPASKDECKILIVVVFLEGNQYHMSFPDNS